MINIILSFLKQEESALRLRIFNDLKITKKCRLFIAKEPLFPDQHAFALRKSDPMTKILSDECVSSYFSILVTSAKLIFHKRLILLRQMGLLEHWRISHLPPPNRCSAPLSSCTASVSLLLSGFFSLNVCVEQGNINLTLNFSCNTYRNLASYTNILYLCYMALKTCNRDCCYKLPKTVGL